MSGAGVQLSADGLATVGFLTGVGADGRLIEQDSGWSWDPTISRGTVYDGYGWAHKFGGGGAGTPATVGYWFDPASSFTAAQQGIIAAALALWSAEAGISFVPAGSAAAGLGFYRPSSANDPGTSFGTYTNYTAPGGQLGGFGIPGTTAAYTSFDTGPAYWSRLDSFTAFGGYGVDTVVHELGHDLGLFHSGPYDGAVIPMAQQFNSTDSRQWSIMSYIDPGTPAKYSASYAYPAANWGTGPDGYQRVPTTPMPLDILATQRLYGPPASTPLSGGQVFGFHCNIGGAIAPFFDFTVNTAPVVTLWDAGGSNTLDLSGFGGPATVDLEPGTFSSAGGMIDNIGIAYGTRIDRLVGPQGGGSVTLNGDGDTVQGSGGVLVAVLPMANSVFVIGPASGGATTLRAATGAIDLFSGVQGLRFTGGNDTIAVTATGTFDLAGGGNQLYLGDAVASVRSAGGDIVVAGAGGAAVASAGTAGSLIFGTAGWLNVTGGGGVDTVVTGLGGAVVAGGNGGALVWAGGALDYTGGQGTATVAGAANASVSVRGGVGGGVFVGGGAGGNVLDATFGAATMLGGGNGDRIAAMNAADNVLIAGAGSETLDATGATGTNVFFTGADTAAITGGSGIDIYIAGHGAATIAPGTGNAILECVAGLAGGTFDVAGWNTTQDRLYLAGYAPGAAAAAIGGATTGAGGTTITLADHTRILFANVTGINANWFL